jgi:hypothetical protein
MDFHLKIDAMLSTENEESGFRELSALFGQMAENPNGGISPVAFHCGAQLLFKPLVIEAAEEIIGL